MSGGTRLAAVAAIALLAAACSSAGEGRTGARSLESIEASPIFQETPGGTVLSGAWRTLTLEDVRTGESFRIADLEGKLVAIEPMAIWCSNCRIQHREAVAALAALDSEDLVFLGIDVDPNERGRDLARYAREEGFDWPFVVASRELARELADAFGPQVLSPPSTPTILIAPDGGVIEVHFGIRRADELVALFEEHLPAG